MLCPVLALNSRRRDACVDLACAGKFAAGPSSRRGGRDILEYVGLRNDKYDA